MSFQHRECKAVFLVDDVYGSLDEWPLDKTMIAYRLDNEKPTFTYPREFDLPQVYKSMTRG